jgi:two-component system NtrC family sensor kinase
VCQDKEEPVSTDLNQILELALSISGNELKYHVEIFKEFAELPKLLCYPRQLEQVFVNLLVNAAHAIEKKGSITVRTYQKDKSLIVEVADTGSGIPEEVLPHIFDPFFTTKEAGKGTGLGLAVSYGIIKKHQGHISVKSMVGIGTTFIVKLPVDGTAV